MKCKLEDGVQFYALKHVSEKLELISEPPTELHGWPVTGSWVSPALVGHSNQTVSCSRKALLTICECILNAVFCKACPFHIILFEDGSAQASLIQLELVTFLGSNGHVSSYLHSLVPNPRQFFVWSKGLDLHPCLQFHTPSAEWTGSRVQSFKSYFLTVVLRIPLSEWPCARGFQCDIVDRVMD